MKIKLSSGLIVQDLSYTTTCSDPTRVSVYRVLAPTGEELFKIEEFFGDWFLHLNGERHSFVQDLWNLELFVQTNIPQASSFTTEELANKIDECREEESAADYYDRYIYGEA